MTVPHVPSTGHPHTLTPWSDSHERVSLLRAALDYAAAGLHVHPVMPRGKVPVRQCDMCRSTRCPGPDTCHHDACHGLLDATCDPARIRAWWARWPRCNVGVSTGPSALAVVDLDGPAGVTQWRAMLGEHPDTPTTLTSRTPSGGAHLWYRADPARPCPSTVKKLAGDIDTRALGGYVVAPPSVRRDGAYRWTGAAVELDALPTIPAWITAALTPPAPPPRALRPPSAAVAIGTGQRAAYVAAAVAGEVQRVMDATPGDKARGRNRELFIAALSLGRLVVAGDVDRTTVVIALAQAAEAVGLGAREADRTITSGLTAATRPRRMPA